LRLAGGRKSEQLRRRQAEVDLGTGHDGDARSVAIAMAVCGCCFWVVSCRSWKTRGEEMRRVLELELG
jgi:hypothetical protein